MSDEIELVTPEYWDEARKYLTRKDRVMKRLIPQFGSACLQSRGDAFNTLARSIVGQQISVKAAQSVWERFSALPKRMTPANVLKLKVDDMRGLAFVATSRRDAGEIGVMLPVWRLCARRRMQAPALKGSHGMRGLWFLPCPDL